MFLLWEVIIYSVKTYGINDKLFNFGNALTHFLYNALFVFCAVDPLAMLLWEQNYKVLCVAWVEQKFQKQKFKHIFFYIEPTANKKKKRFALFKLFHWY